MRNVTFVNLEPIGVVQPEGALGAAVGEPAFGPWALVIVDDSGGTTGMLQGWSMTITTLSSLPLRERPPTGDLLAKPFDERLEFATYAEPAPADQCVYRTFCGT